VAAGAELGEDVEVGPFTIIEDDVQIGDGCRIGPHCVIKPRVTIGRECMLDVGVILGSEPQDAKFGGEESFVRIGDRNTLREYVTIHRATGEGETTTVGNDNFIMATAHLGHNVVMGSDCMIAGYVGIAGHCVIEDRVTIGGFVGVHQYTTIGTMVMIGGVTAVTTDVPPGIMAVGAPMRFHSLNIMGLKRGGVQREERRALHTAFKTIYRSEEMNTSEAIAAIRAQGEPEGLVKRFIEFIERIEDGSRGRQVNPR